MILKYLLLFCLTGVLSAQADQHQVIHYEVSYLKLPLLDMTLTWIEDDSSVSISYDNRLKPLIAWLHPIHNVYRVHFMKTSFAPLSWSKSVLEGDLQFELQARRSTDGLTVTYSNGSRYPFPAGGFTVFAATHYLAARAGDPRLFPVTLPVFIDGQTWEATARRFDTTQPHPDHSLQAGEVLIQTDLHYVRGKSVVSDNDILTSVIATEGTRFLLWVAPDGSYRKAQFGEFPKAVVLERRKN